MVVSYMIFSKLIALKNRKFSELGKMRFTGLLIGKREKHGNSNCFEGLIECKNTC